MPIALTMVVVMFAAHSVQAQDVRTATEQLAGQIAKGAPEDRQLRLAIADFADLQGVTNELGRFIASRLTTRLAQHRTFLIVERQRLNQVLRELRFSMSDLVDPTKAKQLGRMAGVDAVVVGSISDFGNQVDVDARLIEIETNRMLLGTSVTIGKDPAVVAMMERGRQEPIPPQSMSDVPGTLSSGDPPLGPGRADVVDGFQFQPRGCRKVSRSPTGSLSGPGILCSVALTNTTNEDRSLFVHGGGCTPKTLMVDERGGAQYAPVAIIADNSSNCGLEASFPPQIAMGVSFFVKTDDDLTRIAVVIGIRGFKRQAVVRNLQVGK